MRLFVNYIYLRARKEEKRREKRISVQHLVFSWFVRTQERAFGLLSVSHYYSDRMKLSVEMSFMMSFQISYYCDKMSEPIIRLLEMHRTGEMENRSLTRDEFLSLLGDCNLPFRWEPEYNAASASGKHSSFTASNYLVTQISNFLDSISY